MSILTSQEDEVRRDDDVAVGQAAPRSRRLLAIIAVAALAVGLAVWFDHKADEATQAATAGRATLGEGPAKALERDVTTAMTRLWSYDFHDPADVSSLTDITTPAFLHEYRPVYKRLVKLAQGVEAVVTARVVGIAVISMTEDRSQLLVFLDQTAVKGRSAPIAAGARLRVQVERVDGDWRVAQATPF